MRMRTTIAAFALVGSAVGCYVYTVSSTKACEYHGTNAAQLERCALSNTTGGVVGAILPFTGAGALLGVFLTPVFYTRKDDEKKELRRKQKKLKELKQQRQMSDLDAQIAELSK